MSRSWEKKTIVRCFFLAILIIWLIVGFWVTAPPTFAAAPVIRTATLTVSPPTIGTLGTTIAVSPTHTLLLIPTPTATPTRTPAPPTDTPTLTLTKVASVTLPLATQETLQSTVPSTQSSSYQASDLVQINRIALVSVEGELENYPVPIKCASALKVYARSLDDSLTTHLESAYVPLKDVMQDPVYLQLTDSRDTKPTMTTPENVKILKLDGTTKQELSKHLGVDGLLVINIKYYFHNSEDGITFWAYPSASLYVPEKDKPVWEYVGIGVSADLDVPLDMKLALAAKRVVFANFSEEEISRLMDLAAEKNDQLAMEAANQASQELMRARQVARGEQALSLFDLATSGRWGAFFEWKAMGASIVLFLVCAVLQVAAYRFSRMKWNTEGAGQILALILLLASFYYLFQFFKAVF